MLADGAGDDEAADDVAADERQAAYEKHLREQVESIVSSVVGPGHSRVQVAADFDFNRITETSDKFDPDGRVVRSSQSREETSASNQGNPNEVTVGNELPGHQSAAARRRGQCRPGAIRAARPKRSSTTRFPRPPRRK